MNRRRVWYPLLAAASFLSVPGAVAQDADGLRPALDDISGEAEPQVPQAVAAPPTSLTVNPQLAPESPPLRRRVTDTDPYGPLDVDLGGFRAFPSLIVGVTATDNVAQSNSGRDSDIGLALRPALRIESDWIRHRFELEGKGDFVFYDGRSDEDTTAADVRSKLRLDVRHTTNLDVEAGYRLTQENASSLDVPDSAVSDRTDQSADAALGLTHRFGRLESTLRGGALWQTYDDVKLRGGGVEDNSDRDYVEPRLSLRNGYEVSPAFRPFVEMAYEPRFHDEEIDRNGLRRDSDGYRVGVGAAFDPSPLWSGELALLYLSRDYDDRSLETIDGFGLAGHIMWRPTDITRIRMTTSTELNETSIANASGSREYAANLELAHDLRYNLTALARFGAVYEEFQGIDEDEVTLSANAGIIWRLGRSIAVIADYDFTWADSSVPSSDYHEHRVTAGVEFRR